MSDPYLSEIRLFPFGYAPKGWAFCNGQTLSIQQNNALFALIGTIYGGNGTTTFMLPNLQGRVLIHQGTSFQGTSFTMGEIVGEATHTLTIPEMPSHMHAVMAANTTGGTDIPAPGVALGLAHTVGSAPVAVNIYGTGGLSVAFSPAAVSTVGGSQPHPNQQPFLVMNYCMALSGVFPSRS